MLQVYMNLEFHISSLRYVSRHQNSSHCQTLLGQPEGKDNLVSKASN